MSSGDKFPGPRRRKVLNADDVCPVLQVGKPKVKVEEFHGQAFAKLANNRKAKFDLKKTVVNYDETEQDDMVVRLLGHSSASSQSESYPSKYNTRPSKVSYAADMTDGIASSRDGTRASLRISSRDRGRQSFTSGLTPQVHSLGLTDTDKFSPGVFSPSRSSSSNTKATPGDVNLRRTPFSKSFAHCHLVSLTKTFVLARSSSAVRHRHTPAGMGYVSSGLTPGYENDSPSMYLYNSNTPFSEVSMYSLFSPSIFVNSPGIDGLPRNESIVTMAGKIGSSCYICIMTKIRTFMQTTRMESLPNLMSVVTSFWQ
jgi:hypothetical protein